MRRLVLLAFIWGWSFLFIKVAGEGLTPFTVAWGRIALGALTLWAFLRHQGGRLPIDRATLPHFLVTAVAGNILPFTMLAYAEEHIDSAVAGVLNATTPLFTALFAAIFLSERLRAVQVVGLGLGLVGVAVAGGVGAGDVRGASLLATLAAALAGAGYGLTFVHVRRHLTGIPPVAAATGQLAIGAALFWPAALVSSLVGGVSLTPTRVGSLLMLGAVGTGVAYVLSYRVVADLGATAASLVTYLIPVVAVLVGVLVLHEAFEWRLVVGGAITILGVAAVNRKRPEPVAGDRPGATPAGVGSALDAGPS